MSVAFSGINVYELYALGGHPVYTSTSPIVCLGEPILPEKTEVHREAQPLWQATEPLGSTVPLAYPFLSLHKALPFFVRLLPCTWGCCHCPQWIVYHVESRNVNYVEQPWNSLPSSSFIV